jgi:hypothetical protein
VFATAVHFHLRITCVGKAGACQIRVPYRTAL